MGTREGKDKMFFQQAIAHAFPCPFTNYLSLRSSWVGVQKKIRFSYPQKAVREMIGKEAKGLCTIQQASPIV